MKIQKIIQEFVEWIFNDFFEGVLETMEQAIILAWKIIKAIFWTLLAIATIELWIIPFAIWLFCCRNDGEE